MYRKRYGMLCFSIYSDWAQSDWSIVIVNSINNDLDQNWERNVSLKFHHFTPSEILIRVIGHFVPLYTYTYIRTYILYVVIWNVRRNFFGILKRSRIDITVVIS